MLAAAGCRAVQSWAWAWLPSIASGQRRTAVASVGQQHSRRYSVPTSHRPSETRWRYKADDLVKKKVALVQAGVANNTFGLTLNTARPLSPDLFKEVLMHLYKKVEVLRICFGEKEGSLWVVDMDTPKIDFQVLEGGLLEEIVKTVSQPAYNLFEGPLWRARLVVCPPDEPCMMPQVKYSFPHQYHLALDNHHAVTDGICTMKIIEIIITILDSVLDGAHVDSKQIGEFRDRSEVTSVEVRIRESLEKDPHMLSTLLEERYKIKTSVPLITEIFGKPDEPSPETYTVTPQVIDDKLLQVFSAKCKTHKVTFNSAFVGVINVALMELAHEAGVARDSYIITHRHPVDTRRYMSDVTCMVWGYHVVPMTHTTTMPCNARSTFWENVINFDTNFRDRINTMGPLQERILDTILQERKPDFENTTIHNLNVTNMYSPRIKTSGDGKHVQLTNSCGYLPLPFTHHDYCITGGLTRFREQVQFQVGYYSGFITTENATRLSDKVISVFKDTAKEVDERQ
ncbi:hypothetical protein O3P69_016576 [Scylla paramamosain]|uniref:Condensation domain-containing protein n=2 Tax=Scylla paramamosain TaxID=85552 RepID=A0AAW0SYL8_SCYPA